MKSDCDNAQSGWERAGWDWLARFRSLAGARQEAVGSRGVGLARPGKAIKRILVPTDFSACSTNALHEAVTLARESGAVITLLYVVDLKFHTPTTGPTDLGQLRAVLWKEGLGRIGQMALELAGQGVDVQTSIREGLSHEQIVEAAREADLIVMGKRRRKPFWHSFSRNTVEGVLQSAVCPVMTIPEGQETASVKPKTDSWNE